jgi:hypothetical protein
MEGDVEGLVSVAVLAALNIAAVAKTDKTVESA